MADYSQAVQQRDAGIEMAASNDAGRRQRGQTQAVLDDIITEWLVAHPTLFIDDLWEAVAVHPSAIALGLEPGKYVGAALQRAVRDGRMERMEAGGKACWFVARQSIRNNLAPKWVFRSLIYQDQLQWPDWRAIALEAINRVDELEAEVTHWRVVAEIGP